MKLKINFIFFLFITNVCFSQTFKENTHYIQLDKRVESVPSVIEFFSFYCQPCFSFFSTYHVVGKIREKLPSDTKVYKYHVSEMGAFGNELTIAWSVAFALGIDDEMEMAFFELLKKNNNIINVNDIKGVFSDHGVDSACYDKAKSSVRVKDLVYKQNQAASELGVFETPSFYILGRYKINNQGISDKTTTGYATEYADTILYLLNLNK